MSNLDLAIRPGQDGVLTFVLPISAEAKFPLVDVRADTGMFCYNLVISPGSLF
jgi:hypothetical protein